MKKLLILLALLIILIVYSMNSFIVMTKDYNGKYSLHLPDEEISEEYNLSFSKALSKHFLTGNSKGQSIRFLGNDSDVKELLDKMEIQIVDRQNLANITIIYGYTVKLGKPVTLKGQKVNIQIAKRGASITVGTPLILGSY